MLEWFYPNWRHANAEAALPIDNIQTHRRSAASAYYHSSKEEKKEIKKPFEYFSRSCHSLSPITLSPPFCLHFSQNYPSRDPRLSPLYEDPLAARSLHLLQVILSLRAASCTPPRCLPNSRSCPGFAAYISPSRRPGKEHVPHHCALKGPCGFHKFHDSEPSAHFAEM